MGMSCWRGKLKAAARDFYVERAASKLGELQSLDSEWSKDLLLSRDNGTITLIDLSRAAAGAWMRSLQTLNAEQTQDFARAGYKSTSLSDIVTMVKGPPGHWKGRADRDARSSEGRPLNVLLSRQKQAVVIFGDKDWIKITITGNEAKKLKNPGYENCHFIKMFDWMQRNGRLVEEPTESRPGLVPICRQNPATQVQTLIFVIDIHHGQRVEELVAFEEGRMQTQKYVELEQISSNDYGDNPAHLRHRHQSPGQWLQPSLPRLPQQRPGRPTSGRPSHKDRPDPHLQYRHHRRGPKYDQPFQA